MACHPHVDDVVIFQVHFGRTARPLHHQNLIFRRKFVKALGNNSPHAVPAGEILPRRQRTQRLTHDDNLRAIVGFRLQQYGVHVDCRLHTRRLRLHHLGASRLPAVVGDEGVQRHVLRFERRHIPAVLAQDPAQRRHQNALAYRGGSSLYHYRLGWHIRHLPRKIIPPVKFVS